MHNLTLRVAAALLAGATLVAAPAIAQEKPAAVPKYKFSKPVQALLAKAQEQQKAGDYAGMIATLQEAQAFPTPTADDTFVTDQLMLNAAALSKNEALLEQQINRLIASGRLDAATQTDYMRRSGSLALQRKDYNAATIAFEKLIAANPNDADAIAALAELYFAQKQVGKAVATLTKAIDASAASGKPAPENWYKRRLAMAYDGKLAADIQPAAQGLVKAYPTSVNWRDAVVITQDGFGNIDDQTQLDFLRLQAATNSLNGERDFVEYADTALGKGYPGEAAYAINEGIKRNMLTPTKPLIVELKKAADSKVASDKASLPGLEKESKGNPKIAMGTGDAYYGYGDFAKAAAMYKLAQGGAGVDPNTLNLRLGAALARSGDLPGAKAALEQVKGGPRESLAQYWLIFVGQGGKAA
jgi:tetratricopeptide (TPR) repeat protein